MNLYIYAQSGHNFGLDRIRKAAVIAKKLKKYDPILATADYRAATFAKQQLDVAKGVGVDVITNLPNVMNKGDFLIYDSTEVSEVTRSYMEDYCTLLYEVNENITSIIVDDIYKNSTKQDHTIEKLFFYGNDDYSDTLLKQVETENTKYDINLLMGHYMFLGNEDKLEKYFTQVIDEEEYNDTIKESKYILTGSEQTALEAIANNANPVLLLRDDKEYANIDLLKQCNIPMIAQEDKSLQTIFDQFDKIIETYPDIKRDIFDQFDTQIEDILKQLSQYDKIIQITNDAMPLHTDYIE